MPIASGIGQECPRAGPGGSIELRPAVRAAQLPIDITGRIGQNRVMRGQA